MGKLIVILILALAVGMTVPRTRAMLEEEARPLIDHFKVKVVPGRLKAIADELQAQISRGEGYPPNWSGWLKFAFTGSPLDPWGNEYYLKRTPAGFTVGSDGPDGIAGNADDIRITRDLGRR